MRLELDLDTDAIILGLQKRGWEVASWQYQTLEIKVRMAVAEQLQKELDDLTEKFSVRGEPRGTDCDPPKDFVERVEETLGLEKRPWKEQIAEALAPKSSVIRPYKIVKKDA